MASTKANARHGHDERSGFCSATAPNKFRVSGSHHQGQAGTDDKLDNLEKLTRSYVRTPRLNKRRHAEGDYRLEQKLDDAKKAFPDATNEDRFNAHRDADRERDTAALGGDKLEFLEKHKVWLSRRQKKFISKVAEQLGKGADRRINLNGLDEDDRERIDALVAKVRGPRGMCPDQDGGLA
jgi:hypothetical protein